MGKITAGILGGVRGKVAGVVGGQWKDKAYLRGYVIPANPNTLAQQGQRSKMSIAVALLKPLIGQVFNPFVDKFQKSMSGFNFAISQNIAYCVAPPTTTNFKVCWGKLYMPTTITGTYTTGTGNGTVTFDTGLGQNGLATDKMHLVVYDKNASMWYFQTTPNVRSDGFCDISLPTGLSATNLTAYIFAVQLDLAGIVSMVSDSRADVFAAA